MSEKFILLKEDKYPEIFRIPRDDYMLMVDALRLDSIRQPDKIRNYFGMIVEYLKNNISKPDSKFLIDSDPNYPLICKIDKNKRVALNIASLGGIPLKDRNLNLSVFTYCSFIYFALRRDLVPFVEWINMGSMLTGIMAKVFGRKYGLFSLEVDKQELLDFYCKLFSYLGMNKQKNIKDAVAKILQHSRYTTPVSNFIEASKIDIGNFYTIDSFIELLSQDLFVGLDKFQFTSTILQRLGPNNLVIFEDGMYFGASIISTRFHNKLFPPIFKIFNEGAYNSLLRYYDNTIYKWSF